VNRRRVAGGGVEGEGVGGGGVDWWYPFGEDIMGVRRPALEGAGKKTGVGAMNGLSSKMLGRSELRVQDVLTDQDSEENDDFLEDSHPEESPCALCRRCQMRKRLEKKVAERNASKVNGDEDDLSMVNSSSKAAMDVLEDNRSIDDLLSFINGRDDEMKSKTKKRSKRKAKKTKKESGLSNEISASSLAQSENGSDGVLKGEKDIKESRSSSVSSGAEEEKGSRKSSVASRNSCDGAQEGLEELTSTISTSTCQADKEGASTSKDMAEDKLHGDGTHEDADQTGAYGMMSLDFLEVPSDVEEEIEREVEEFRRSLAEASASAAGNKLKPMLIPNLTMCNITH